VTAVAQVSAPQSDRAALESRARFLARATVGWNCLEAAVAVGAGVVAGSVALVGFGLDSAVEVGSALVILWQMRGASEERERRALRLIALSFWGLAFYVAVQAVLDLVQRSHPGTSPVGIGVAVASLAVMPLLARAKKRAGRRLGSASVEADSKQTRLCAWLSGILLGGLLLDATVGWWWADPFAALGIAVLAANEGREAWTGDACCD
jgi:divalent metal cation (Fe/Co/Zn/Cd) transporter